MPHSGPRAETDSIPTRQRVRLRGPIVRFVPCNQKPCISRVRHARAARASSTTRLYARRARAGRFFAQKCPAQQSLLAVVITRTYARPTSPTRDVVRAFDVRGDVGGDVRAHGATRPVGARARREDDADAAAVSALGGGARDDVCARAGAMRVRFAMCDVRERVSIVRRRERGAQGGFARVRAGIGCGEPRRRAGAARTRETSTSATRSLGW